MASNCAARLIVLIGVFFVFAFFPSTGVNAKVESNNEATVKENIGRIKTSSKTDEEVIQRLGGRSN
uniref:Uncharacterized protein n=1 Tax=Wuchereria bancrofti TaxID=6293 RepID=A0A1I8ESR0_WUCBA